MDLGLTGKVAPVTGARRGIGRAIELTAFLASARAGYIHAALVECDGGVTRGL